MSKLADIEMAQSGEEPDRSSFEGEDIGEDISDEVLDDGSVDIIRFNQLVKEGEIDDEETIKSFYKQIRARDFTSAVILGGSSGILGALALPFTGVKLLLLKLCERKDLETLRKRKK